MNILFARKYQVIIHDSLENVQQKLLKLCSKTELNIAGKLGYGIEEDTFVFYPKWSPFTLYKNIFVIIERKPTFIIARLKSEENYTVLKFTVRPNIFQPIVFYSSLCIFFSLLINKPDNLEVYFLLIPFVLCIIFFVFMRTTTLSITKLFADFMDLEL
jgi:hypothetical protein